MQKFILTVILGVVLLSDMGCQPAGEDDQLIAGTNKLINYKPNELPLVEPHLAVNPTNKNHIVAAAIVFDSAAVSSIRTHIVLFATKDNGKTWKQTDLSMTVGFDPGLVI